jgi:hypothetical protein
VASVLLFMSMRSLVLFSGSAAAFFLSAAAAVAAVSSSVRAYPAIPEEPLSSQFTVKAGGQTVPVYVATVAAMSSEAREKSDWQHFAPGDLGQTSLGSFDMRGPAHIAVTCPGPINTIKLLPTSCKIIPKVSGNSATFTINKPGQYDLEVNGDTVQSLQIFANPWDEKAPDPNDPNVIYFGPGIHKVTSIPVTSGKTVYIAGDAVVYGTPGDPAGPIFDLKGDNITLRGRGIIDSSLCPHDPAGRPCVAAEGTHITIEGVIERDAGSWTTPLTGCDHVTIKNIKVFGHRGNSDGIDVNGCRNVDISNCYIRTGDDLIVVKTQIPGKGESRHITVEHCVLWNELAHALSLGAEIREPIGDVVFSDCDVIHDKGREWLLRIFQCDAGAVDNITFRNIRIEECNRLASLWISTASYSLDPGRGYIDNVTFQNITTPAPLRPEPPVEILDSDADHATHDAKFDHVVVGGRPLKESDVQKDAYADGIVITP